jgi:hypothetical protein
MSAAMFALSLTLPTVAALAAWTHHTLTTATATASGDILRRVLAESLTTLYAALVDPDGPHARTFTAPAPVPACQAARKVADRRARRAALAGRVSINRACTVNRAHTLPALAGRPPAFMEPGAYRAAARRARRAAALADYANNPL